MNGALDVKKVTQRTNTAVVLLFAVKIQWFNALLLTLTVGAQTANQDGPSVKMDVVFRNAHLLD